MSHKSVASAWSALTDLPDLTAGLRDAVGNSILRQIRSSYNPVETPRRFLEYAHELGLAFDAIRFISKVDSKNTPLLQEDLVSAVAHFLSNLANDCVSDQTVLKDASHKLILGYALCSAVATLRACAWDCRPELRTVLCKQAGKLLTNVPVKDESLWLHSSLSYLLVEHYGSATPLGQGNDQSNTRWKMLWEAKAGRQGIVQDMVKRATDNNVPSAERILPMLDLCQLYWDTDSLLIQACAGLTKQRWLERVFYVPSDGDAIVLAMEVRFAVQEQFAIRRNMRSSSGSDNLQTQSYVMFRPGLGVQCVSDACQCTFDAKVMPMITEARASQNSLLRSMVGTAFNDSGCIGMSREFFETIHTGYAQRLRGRSSPSPVFSLPIPVRCEEEDPLPEVMPLRPRLVSSLSESDTAAGRKQVEVKARSASQPNIHRRYSRPKLPSTNKYAEWKSSSTTALHTQVEESHDTEDEEDEAPPDHNTSSASSAQSPTGAPELGRADSVTTTSTSTGSRSRNSQIPQINTFFSDKELEHSFPEPVQIVEDRPFVSSPLDFEKSYPEVAVGPVTAIHEDNMSLFSDGSMPMTTRSGSAAGPGARAPNQRKFSLFKGTKKVSGQFAVPTTRFFASGKHIIAWTRYGGACIDVGFPEIARMQAINTGDIVLAAGGSRRYAVVARYQDAYTLSVYTLGDIEPGLKVNLGSCPKAMDMSRNDQFLAIKYFQGVRVFDLVNSTKIDHKLPKMESSNNPPSGHMVTFSHDSQSFMASTRNGPEKVLTYWSHCMSKSNSMVVNSTAPCGNIDDHGLTGLTLAGPSVRGIPTGFLSTFTEKGAPVILSMNPHQPHSIAVRGSRDMIGTRIHGAGMHVDPHTKKSNLVMVNQDNEIYWITDLFGRGQDIQKIKTLKRPKSMKPELMVSMPNADEASLFWIDHKLQCGWLAKVGKSGGMTKPTEIRLNVDPICSG